MKVIWKFTIGPGRQTIEMPEGAVVVAVQTQAHHPCMWALCDENAPKETRTFRVVATGEPFDLDGMEYLGTFQLRDGVLVFHAFEEVGS